VVTLYAKDKETGELRVLVGGRGGMHQQLGVASDLFARDKHRYLWELPQLKDEQIELMASTKAGWIAYSRKSLLYEGNAHILESGTKVYGTLHFYFEGG